MIAFPRIPDANDNGGTARPDARIIDILAIHRHAIREHVEDVEHNNILAGDAEDDVAREGGHVEGAGFDVFPSGKVDGGRLVRGTTWLSK